MSLLLVIGDYRIVTEMAFNEILVHGLPDLRWSSVVLKDEEIKLAGSWRVLTVIKLHCINYKR